MQQYLPFTVLKLSKPMRLAILRLVATVLTVYGIETISVFHLMYMPILYVLQQYLPFTVLKLYYGLHLNRSYRCNSTYRLRY